MLLVYQESNFKIMTTILIQLMRSSHRFMCLILIPVQAVELYMPLFSLFCSKPVQTYNPSTPHDHVTLCVRVHEIAVLCFSLWMFIRSHIEAMIELYNFKNSFHLSNHNQPTYNSPCSVKLDTFLAQLLWHVTA